MRFVKAIARAARAVVGSAPFVGAAYVVALTAWSGRASREADVDLARRAESYEPFASLRIGAEIARAELGAVALAVAFGVALGLVAELLVTLRGAARRRTARTAREIAEVALVVAAVHALVVAWSMADAPQLYAPRWYGRGGLPRTVQVLATDVLGQGGVVLLAAVLAVFYVRPARTVSLARRAVHRLRASMAVLLAKKSSPAVLVLGIGAAAAFAAAGAGETKPAHAALSSAPADGSPMNVLVLAAGSLRADRLEPRLAPNLARFAEEATRFDRAYVTLPRTTPSWVTLLTGRDPHRHGIRSAFPTPEERAAELDALPTRFAAAGYTTALLSDGRGDVFGRLDLGFERVDAPPFDVRALARQRALERKTAILPLLRSRVGHWLVPSMRAHSSVTDPMLLADDVARVLRDVRGRPFFLTVSFSTTRAPYAAPAPHYATYTDRAYRGRFKYDKPATPADGVALDDDDVRQVRALYDGAVTAVDTAVGRVLRSLEALGLSERTIVVVTSDHGEGLGDHGRGHGHGGHLLGDEGTHVPLVIRDPRAAGDGRREERVVRDVDVAPTLYELTGVAPPPDLDGRSLAPALRGEPLDPRVAYAETGLWLEEEALPAELRIPYTGMPLMPEVDPQRPGAGLVLRQDMGPTTLVARHRMVRDERYKLVYVPTRSGVRYLLFDTLADPDETKDVADAVPDEVARLRSELWAWMLRDPSMEQRDGYLVPRQPARPRGSAGPRDENEVFLRLVEVAHEASFDVPRGDAARALVAAHGGQRPVFLEDRALPFVTKIALRRSVAEALAAPPFGERDGFHPDARIHRADEGTFDEREALVSASPGTIAFRIDVPRGGKLTFARGTLPATREPTVFVVSVADASGAVHELYRGTHEPGDPWRDASCDLSAFTGQSVELRLVTEPAGTDAPRKQGAPVALWGNPVIVTSGTPHVGHNVLWITVDGLRADAVASLRDEPADAKQPLGPLEAWLRTAAVTPSIDALAKRGARFYAAYSASPWTRAGTLAMLAGARSTELGLDATSPGFERQHVQRFYASEPPLLPLALRRRGVSTAAFLSGDARSGHGPLGVDMGFERVEGHRYRTRDTLEITRSAAEWIDAHKDTRFFAFVRYASPTAPYDPAEHHLKRTPPGGEPVARRYMGEVAKDDEAIGVLVRALEAAGVSERTIVVVTAGHGEPLSPARTSKLIGPTRGDPAASNYEEATRVPLVVVAPGLLAPSTKVTARVRTIDVAPTVLELLGLEPHARTTGQSLFGLATGAAEPGERVVVTEARGTRALLHGRWRLVARATGGGPSPSTPVELYDLEADPRERRDLSADEPEVVAEMKARLHAALENAPVAGAPGPEVGDGELAPVLRLRFAGGPEPRRVVGTITVGDETTKAKSFRVEPVELGREALRIEGHRVEVAFRTSPAVPTGFDLVLDPPTLAVTWELWLDDRPWPEASVFGGPFGLPAPALRRGVSTDEARREARAWVLPHIDASRETGLFVTRERRVSDASAQSADATRLLREWLYAHAGP